jgi:predicted nucleic acid-binding protein
LNFVICDTNIFISLFRNIEKTFEELALIGNANILITSISVMELYQGMQNKRELEDMRKKIGRYNILHFNQNSSTKAIDLIHHYRLSHNLEIPDAIIAAVSVVYNIPLFTYNVKDFKFIPGLTLYEPTA